MRYIAGIDIGNSSTEVALATLDEAGALTITHSALAETTGIKGTLRNVFGIQEALALVAKRAGIGVGDISLIRINEATPVIGDVAMETITETIITESTMIGHNPKTPGGVGLGVGITITPQELLTRPAEAPISWWCHRPSILPISRTLSTPPCAPGIRLPASFCNATMACWSATGWKNRCRSLTKCCTSTAFRWECWRRLRSPSREGYRNPLQPLRYRHRIQPQRRGDQKHRPDGPGADWQSFRRGGQNAIGRR